MSPAQPPGPVSGRDQPSAAHLPQQGESLANIKPEGNKLASVASVYPRDLLTYLTYLKYVFSSGASGSTPNHSLTFNGNQRFSFQGCQVRRLVLRGSREERSYGPSDWKLGTKPWTYCESLGKIPFSCHTLAFLFCNILLGTHLLGGEDGCRVSGRYLTSLLPSLSPGNQVGNRKIWFPLWAFVPSYVSCLIKGPHHSLSESIFWGPISPSWTSAVSHSFTLVKSTSCIFLKYVYSKTLQPLTWFILESFLALVNVILILSLISNLAPCTPYSPNLNDLLICELHTVSSCLKPLSGTLLLPG